jgi:hypothetical protein
MIPKKEREELLKPKDIKKLASSRHKSKSVIVAMILMLVLVPVSLYIPIASADVPTYAFIAVSPNPVGLNQQVTVIMWLDKINPTASGPSGSRWNFTVSVTKPDGTADTLGPFTADDASYAWTIYTPDQIGTYAFKMNFDGMQVTGVGAVIPTPVNEYYKPSNSTTTLTVQDQNVNPSPQTPLPTSYWSRPINAQNQQWYSISGNWLGTGTGSFGYQVYNASGNFNPYTKAPDSAHIVWTKALTFGGLIGGEFGDSTTSNYYTGKTYEPKFTPPVILNGVLYYNSPAMPKEGFYAVDLRTGQTLWWQNSTGEPFNVGANPLIPTYGFSGITMGQIYNYQSPNQIGGIPYLWYMPSFQISTTMSGGIPWYMYDAVTGNLILTFANAVAGGTTVEGSQGELLVYLVGTSWIAMWNSSLCIGTAGNSSTLAWLWRPQVGATLDWQKGLQWNVTTPQPYAGQAIAQINSGIVLATTGSQFVPQNWQWEIAYDATTGTQLWAQNRTLPTGTTNYGLMGPLMNGIYTEFDKGAMQWYGYSAMTGEKIWGPSDAYTDPWGSQPQYATSAYDGLYAMALDGVHALDLSTGQRLWDFYGDDSGVNFPGFSTYPFLGARLTIADGKIFAATGNSHSDPLFRGARLYAINAYSGKEAWSINGFFRDTMPVADGYLVAFNGYDNQIYTFGKGPTATTVTATSGVGNAVTIQGTITDQSPGQTCLGIPAAGTPAISDESMSAWMEYLYMQQPEPTNATGVPVHLTAIGPNGNTEEIGTVTSGIDGSYAVAWTPPLLGLYTINASFAGTNSYYSSSALTHLAVGQAASAAPVHPSASASLTATPALSSSPSPSQAVQPPTSGMPTTTYIAIAAAVVIIVVAAAVVVLRRRK